MLMADMLNNKFDKSSSNVKFRLSLANMRMTRLMQPWQKLGKKRSAD